MTAREPKAAVQAWIAALRNGEHAALRELATADLRVYLNHRRGETDAVGARALWKHFTKACTEVRYADLRLVATGQGALHEELVTGVTRDGASFRLRRLCHFFVNRNGAIYRLEHFLDSAALASLVATAPAAAPAPP
jgi:limonene-1,2-epoxide hydrolase